MLLYDDFALAKVAAAAMAKGCAAAIFAVSFVPSYPFSVDRLPWLMTGVFVAILAVAAVATRFFVAAAICVQVRLRRLTPFAKHVSTYNETML